MQDENSRLKRKRRKINKPRHALNFSQERASYLFFIGLLIIAIFGCVASGAPRQGFYGILFISIGILVALFPPAFITSKWLNIGLILFLISLASPLLPRSFAGTQSWRTNLESLGLETGNLITPHPASTIESIITILIIIILGLCSLGHGVSRKSFVKIATLFVVFVTLYTGSSILFIHNKWDWGWDPNQEFGFFSNRNHMATLMVMGSLLSVGCLFLYLKNKNLLGFVITLLATGIICWAILGYSLSRTGAILFISFQIIWFCLVGKKHLNHKIVTSFIVIFVLAVVLFLFSDSKLEKRFEKAFLEQKNISDKINGDKKNDYSSVLGLRPFIHADTYSMIQNEPWTGTGLGTFEFIFPFYKKESLKFDELVSNSNVLHPESNWLDLAAQAGILSTVIALICIISILILTFLKNRNSRFWMLSLSCMLAVFLILVHGIWDVPGQKIGIVMSGILLIGITKKPNLNEDNISPHYTTFIYQSFAIGIFSLGLILVHSQWYSSKSIAFSDSQTRINKINHLYQLSIDAARVKDFAGQIDYINAAINLTENSIKRSPLDPDLHFIKGKLYSFLQGNEEIIKSSFKIESSLDTTWIKLPLRQSRVLSFIDIKETRRCWINALKRAEKINDNITKSIWYQILILAKQHPIQIRDTYVIIMHKDDSHYIKEWMHFAGSEILKIQMPKILKSKLLSATTKNDISVHWKRVWPDQYNKYLQSQKLN